MRILVISDTHGNLDRFRVIFKKIQEENPVQMIVHCGDHYEDGTALRRTCGIPVIAVKGNCDGEFSDDNFAILETEAGDFLVTHGHMENVGYSLQRLCYKTEENGCIRAIFGHTHRAAYAQTGGMYFMNPGSLTKPRDGSGGTFGILKTDENSVSGKIYRYEDFISKDIDSTGGPRSSAGKPAKITAGKLRSMLNYSDRF